MKKILLLIIIILGSIPFFSEARRTTYFKSKGYQKKGICEGYGQPSKVNGRIKTKRTSGYWKKSKETGVTYVNSYSRSR